MYIIDLFVNIFKGKKFASLFWIILNAFIIVFFIESVVEMLLSEAQPWITWTISIATYFLSIAIALSPIGEALMRWQNGCQKIKDPLVSERIKPLFDEVFNKAIENNPALNRKIKIFICDEESPNAFAVGRKTICITKGLLTMDDYEIKGILAHEFGHLEHKDTDILLIVTVGNMIVTVILTVIGFVIRVFNWIASIFGSMAMSSERGAYILGFVTSKFNMLISMLFGALAWLWTKLGVLICIRSQRKDEYEADKYAYLIGFGNQLKTSLFHFSQLEIKKSKSVWAMLSATHPETSLRVERLDSLEASGSADSFEKVDCDKSYIDNFNKSEEADNIDNQTMSKVQTDNTPKFEAPFKAVNVQESKTVSSSICSEKNNPHICTSESLESVHSENKQGYYIPPIMITQKTSQMNSTEKIQQFLTIEKNSTINPLEKVSPATNSKEIKNDSKELEDISSFSKDYKLEIEATMSMKYYTFYKSVILSFSLIIALVNLVFQAADIINYGIEIYNILITFISFASLIVCSIAIYMLSKKLKKANVFASVSAFLASLVAIVDVGLVAYDYFETVLAIIILCVFTACCIAFSVLNHIYHSRRKDCFRR